MTTKARSRIWGKSDSKAHAGLGFPVVSAGDVGSIPGQGTKISRTTQQVQKIKKKQKNKKTTQLEETEQASEADSDMAEMLELPD